MDVLTGLDILRDGNFDILKGQRIGLVCNQGSVDRQCNYAFDLFRQAHLQGIFELKAIFGPQHGLFGHTQDNMIEWEGGIVDKLTGAAIYSLYGAVREPTEEMVAGIDTLVIDLPDIGSRYYTFIWTTALCLKACEIFGINVIVLDRPNPLGGELVEGTVGNPQFVSFVGLHPLPMRHGQSLGELAILFQKKYYPKVNLVVISVRNWNKFEMFPDFGLRWAMPSPNMPSFDTALVYPGMCLFEATNISEGRGTTRPFETFGAPWINGWEMCERLNNLGLNGVLFRPLEFQPTFQKHVGKVCEGAFIHVRDSKSFRPVATATAILLDIFREYEENVQWNPPPYEYEFEKRPIDILSGNSWFREGIEEHLPLEIFTQRMDAEIEKFELESKLYGKEN